MIGGDWSMRSVQVSFTKIFEVRLEMAQGEIYIFKKITKFNNPMFPQKFLLCLQNSFLEDLWLIALHSSAKWGIDQKKSMTEAAIQISHFSWKRNKFLEQY